MRKFLEGRRLNVLAGRMRRGDRRAAEALYDTLAEKVFGFCMNRVRERHLAEDLSQEIFLKLVSRVETFDQKRGNFTVWFWQLARNTLVDHFRRGKDIVFTDVGDDAALEMLKVEHPQAGLERRFEINRLDRFRKSLGADEQELFELRFIADLSYKEIAGIIGKPEGALRVAVSRLKQKIRDHLTTA